jgi:hypothetical protein
LLCASSRNAGCSPREALGPSLQKLGINSEPVPPAHARRPPACRTTSRQERSTRLRDKSVGMAEWPDPPEDPAAEAPPVRGPQTSGSAQRGVS